jgi:hypothetical protein
MRSLKVKKKHLMWRPRPSAYPSVLNLVSATKLFCQIFMKFGIGVLYKRLSSRSDFRENRLSDSHTLLKGINEFIPYFPCFMIDLD